MEQEFEFKQAYTTPKLTGRYISGTVEHSFEKGERIMGEITKEGIRTTINPQTIRGSFFYKKPTAPPPYSFTIPFGVMGVEDPNIPVKKVLEIVKQNHPTSGFSLKEKLLSILIIGGTYWTLSKIFKK